VQPQPIRNHHWKVCFCSSPPSPFAQVPPSQLAPPSSSLLTSLLNHSHQRYASRSRRLVDMALSRVKNGQGDPPLSHITLNGNAWVVQGTRTLPMALQQGLRRRS
jgi:hypothetical protein